MIRIYQDTTTGNINIEDENGTQFPNTLQAVIDNPTDSYFSIKDTVKDIWIFYNLEYTDYVNENDIAWGSSGIDACNNLNAVFTFSGSNQLPPVITSNSVINSVVGDDINYTVAADYGVSFFWDGLPSDVQPKAEDIRKIIGGTNLSAGIYNFDAIAKNYIGDDTLTITLNVANPPYSNTKSIEFQNNDYLNASANTSNPLYRLNNNSGGTGNAVSLWFKGGSSNNNEQTVLMFGGADQNNGGRYQIYYHGGEERIQLRYGTNNNYLQFQTPNDSVLKNTWTHVLVNYDGGTTENGSGGIAISYSRFSFYIDGILVPTINTNSNFGFSGEVADDFFRIGRNGSTSNYMRNGCKLDEVYAFDSDQSANSTDIYNGGIPFDMSTLATPPVIGYRMGDGDTYPLLIDSFGSEDMTMVNMSIASIVNDVP